jgi:hypothetical protein
MFKIERLESEIIKFLGAIKPKSLNRLAKKFEEKMRKKFKKFIEI